MIPCPGCGLPREDSLVGAVACPVCDAGPAAPAAPARVAKAAAPDPTAHLPSDASQLHAAPATADRRGGLAGRAAAFALGVGVGVGGLLGWQALPPRERPDPETARAEPPATNPPAKPPAAVAPMPREPAPRAVAPKADTPPESPPAAKAVPVPERAAVVPLDDPDAVHTVPPLRKGERFVLRGRVKTLRVGDLDAGAVLDASGLQAESVFVGGKIDGGATLRVRSANGVVVVAGAVAGRSAVYIDAPGGEVKFTRGGPAIDGGSTVTVAGRNVDLRGEVNGVETAVVVRIPGTGSLKVGAVRGIATVEYRVSGEGVPEVVAGVVSPTAAFRRID